MDASGWNRILYILIAGAMAVALDLAVILAWRRRNRRKQAKADLDRMQNPQDSPMAPTSAEKAPSPTASISPLPNPESDSMPTSGAPVAPFAPAAPEPRATATPAEPPEAPADTEIPTQPMRPSPPPPAADGERAHVQLSVDLKPGETIRVTIESLAAGAVPVVERGWQPSRQTTVFGAAPAGPSATLRLKEWLAPLTRRVARWDFATAMLTLALSAYLLSRLIGLTDWPIYFFTDEAIQTNHAAFLLENGFESRDGDFLPTYFTNGGQFNLGVSVYAQALPFLLFGKSAFVTRLVSVLFTLAGAAALALMLRDALRVPVYWAGALVLGTMPAWFLHSRTAFETAEAVSLYAVFLYLYSLYRTRDPRFLFPALLAGGVCFYTYSPAQLVVVATGALLLFSDLPYHWKNRGICLIGLLELLVLALPYLRFQLEHPHETWNHLVILRSYWVQNTSGIEKLAIYFSEYVKGLDPRYWFLPPIDDPGSLLDPGVRDLVRHLMRGYGHILFGSLPFFAAGLGICLWRFRESPYRMVVFALLAAPAGGALASTSITRALFFVVPAAALIAIGLSAAVDLLARRLARRMVEAGLMAGLLAASAIMTADALAKGPVWFADYTLYGMQYGGRQVTDAMRAHLAENPGTFFVVTPTWANGTDEILSFFLPRDFPYRMDSVDSFLKEVRPLGEDDLLIMTAEEYERAVESGKFEDIQVERTLLWPDGRTGFYFVRLRYAGDAAERIAQEQEELAQPVEEVLRLNGEEIRTIHSQVDMGALYEAFDGDPYSLMRGLSQNPFSLEMLFPEPRMFTAIRALVGAAPTRLTAVFHPADGGRALRFSAEIERSTENHEVLLILPQPVESGWIVLEFFVTDEDMPAHVHIYEITLEGPDWTSKADDPAS